MPLITTKQMFADAYKGGYAIGAFNINNMETIQAITEAALEARSPVILQVSAGARKYANQQYLLKMVEAAVACTGLPIALHLDHGGAGVGIEDAYKLLCDCVDSGFTSVMIDGSHYDFNTNIDLTKRVADHAHKHGVVVEAELGKLSGIEDDVHVSDEDSCYTNPGEVKEFVSRTGVDSLAIAIGTSHGAFKFKPGTKPALRFDILEEIGRLLPGFPIVLHGASSVDQAYVDMINANGGAMEAAIGIPEAMLRQAASMAVCKINIDSDIRLAFTGTIRQYFGQNPGHFDPRQYLSPARAAVKQMVSHKIRNVLGSADTVK